MEDVQAILSSSFTSQSSSFVNTSVASTSNNDSPIVTNTDENDEPNFDQDLEELTTFAIKSFVNDVRSSIAKGIMRTRIPVIPNIRTLLVRTMEKESVIAKKDGDASIVDDTNDTDDEQFNERMIDQALVELESETVLSALEQEAADRQHAPWLYSAPEIASTVHTPSSRIENEARQSARNKLIAWFGKLGYTPNTVGLSHIPKPLRSNRALKILEREKGGPNGYTLPSATEEIALLRIRPANGYRTNQKFSTVPRFMEHYKGKNIHREMKDGNEGKPSITSPNPRSTTWSSSSSPFHEEPILKYSSTPITTSKTKPVSSDPRPPYTSPENDNEWKDVTIVDIDKESLSPTNKPFLSDSDSRDPRPYPSSLNISTHSAPDRLQDNQDKDSKHMETSEDDEYNMDIGENFGYDWVWEDDSSNTKAFDPADDSDDLRLNNSFINPELIHKTELRDKNTDISSINNYSKQSLTNMDDSEWEDIEIMDSNNFWSSEFPSPSSPPTVRTKTSSLHPSRPPSAPPSQSSRYHNTLSTTLFRTEQPISSAPTVPSAPFTLPGSSNDGKYTAWAKHEANKLRTMAREHFYGSAYNLRQRLSRSISSAQRKSPSHSSIDPTLYFRKRHPGSVAYTIAPPTDTHTALTDEEYFRLCLVRARQKRGFNIGVQHALSRDIYRALRMFEKRSHGGLPFGPKKPTRTDPASSSTDPSSSRDNYSRVRFHRLARRLYEQAQHERALEALQKDYERHGRQPDYRNADPLIHRSVSMRGRQPVTWKRATELETLAQTTREASLQRKGSTAQSIWYATQLHKSYDVGIENWRKAGLSHRHHRDSSPSSDHPSTPTSPPSSCTTRSRSADPRYHAHAQPNVPVPLFVTMYSSTVRPVTRSLSPSSERYRKHHVRYFQPNRIKADEFKDRLPIRSDHIPVSTDIGKSSGRERKVAVRNKQTLLTEIVRIPFTTEPNKVNEILGPSHAQPGPADYRTDDTELLYRTTRHRAPPRIFIGETTGRKDTSSRSTKEDSALTQDLDYAYGGERFGKYALTTEHSKDGTPKEGDVIDLDPMRAYDRPSQRKYLPSYTFGKGTSGREPVSTFTTFDLFDDDELRPIINHKNNKQSTTYDAVHVKELSRKINKALHFVEAEQAQQIRSEKVGKSTEKIIQNSYINTVGPANYFPDMSMKEDTPPKPRIPLPRSGLPSRYTSSVTSPPTTTTTTTTTIVRPSRGISAIPSIHSQTSTRSSVPNRYTQASEVPSLSSHPSVRSLPSSLSVPSENYGTATTDVGSSSSLYDGIMENNQGTLNYSKHMLTKKQIYK